MTATQKIMKKKQFIKNEMDRQPDCNGHSTVFDGVAWLEDEPGVRAMHERGGYGENRTALPE